MDPIEIIPPDRKKPRPFRLVLLLGMTVLLFLVILNHWYNIADAVMRARGVG